MPVFGVAKFERFFRIAAGLDIGPELKNPQTVHWERSFQLFNLIL